MAIRLWLYRLAKDERAVARLEELMNRAMAAQEGDVVFPATFDAAEVYGILFSAYHAPQNLDGGQRALLIGTADSDEASPVFDLKTNLYSYPQFLIVRMDRAYGA